MDNIAVVHGRYRIRGGGERVANEIARTLDAPLYSAIVDPELVPNDIDLRTLPQKRSEEVVGKLCVSTPLGSKTLYDALVYSHLPELEQHDIVINTHQSSAWYVPTDSQKMLRYIHSPARWCFDKWQYEDPTIIRKANATLMRSLIQQHSRYPDRYLCNSERIANRTQTYLNVPESDLSVVYPPVDVSAYPDLPTDDFYITVGRLAKAKRIDVMIEAFNHRSEELIIAGEGGEREPLEQQAGENITFTGYISEDRKKELLARAKGFIFLGRDEDFGIAPIESFAAGTPVVGVNEGFTQHQIQDEKNGYLCAPTVASLDANIELLERSGVSWDSDEMKAYAQQFGVQRFRDEIQRHVTRLQNREVETQIKTPIEETHD